MLLLDTNVVSELRKVRSGKSDPIFAEWAQAADASQFFLSVVTIQELEIGVSLIERKDGMQGAVLRAWFRDCVIAPFDGRIVPIDIAVALRSARLHVPDPRPASDALIAATAIVHGLTVVTRNLGDFEKMGVSLFNPWLAGT